MDIDNVLFRVLSTWFFAKEEINTFLLRWNADVFAETVSDLEINQVKLFGKYANNCLYKLDKILLCCQCFNLLTNVAMMTGKWVCEVVKQEV